VQCIKNYTHITLTLDHKLFAQAIYRTYEAFTSRCTQNGDAVPTNWIQQ